MNNIADVINHTQKHGCSIDTINHLIPLAKQAFSFNSDQHIEPSIIDYILNLPVFCNEIHVLFDIILSGLLMNDNSQVLWAKWIYNRLLWKQIISPCSDYLAIVTQLASTNKTVHAFTQLRHIMVPAFYSSVNDIPSIRRSFIKNIIELVDSFDTWSDSVLVHPISTIPIFSKIPGFYLTYQDCNNSFHLHYQAKLYTKFLQLSFSNKLPSLNLCSHVKNGKPRIGFVSRFLSNHSIGKITVGLIESLHQKNFEVYVYTLDHKSDVIGAKIAESCFKYVNPSNVLIDWVSHIKDDNLDVLVLLDPIMDINTYLIGCFRLAPCQISTWGHPDTSGLPFIDYYVSSSLFEAQKDDLYTEKLVCFPSMGIYYHHIDDFLQFNSLKTIQSIGMSVLRKQYGLDVSGNVYGVLSSMMKMSPDMDTVINRILNEDDDAVVVLIQGKDLVLFDQVHTRLRKNVTKHDKIIVVSQQSDVFSFLKLVYCMDVILDTFPFGGCITVFECFMMGRCVVTLPGNKLYGRFTQGLYKKMGITEFIASNVDDYVDICLRVCQNNIFKTMIQNEILDKLPLIIKDEESVRDWCDFLTSVIK
jgi:predicted O-linked N-acetylglucosamine transferase (SPINDLY family)